MSWPRTPHYALLLPQADTIGGAGPVVNETPSGALDGVNDTFTLAGFPSNGTLTIHIDGAVQSAYTVSGRAITFTASPSGTAIRASYTRLGSYGDIAEQVVGPQVELLARANASSILMTPRIGVGDAGLAKIVSPDAADAAQWRRANIVSANSGAVNVTTRFVMLGIDTLVSNGTAGSVVVPASDTTVDDLEGSVADDQISGFNVLRRPLGFGLGGSVLVNGAQPLKRLAFIRSAPHVFVIDREYSAGRVVPSVGSVAPATNEDAIFMVFIPADFAGWHEGSGEAAIAVQMPVVCTGTVTASIGLIDTDRVATAFGAGSANKATLNATVANGGTFAPGRWAWVIVRFNGGASGGSGRCDEAFPIIRYEAFARSNV